MDKLGIAIQIEAQIRRAQHAFRCGSKLEDVVELFESDGLSVKVAITVAVAGKMLFTNVLAVERSTW